MEIDESTTPMMSEQQIVNIVKNNEEVEEIEEVQNEEKVAQIVTTKEAIEAYNILSRYIENSKTYNEKKLDLLENLNDCLLEISNENVKQKTILDFYKKV